MNQVSPRYGVIVSVCDLVPTLIVTAWPPVLGCVAIVNVVEGAPCGIVTLVGTVTALAPTSTEIGKLFRPDGAVWPMDTVAVTLPPAATVGGLIVKLVTRIPADAPNDVLFCWPSGSVTVTDTCPASPASTAGSVVVAPRGWCSGRSVETLHAGHGGVRSRA